MELIDTSNWQSFRVGDLFDIHPTRSYKMTNAQLLDNGATPVVANSAYNNGIVGYSTKEPTEKGNIVTFSDTVDANTIFYQPVDFIGYSHVQGLYPIGDYADKWGKYTNLFFVSIFRKTALTKGFDYGNKFRRDIAVDLLIKLPITVDGKPDFTYMNSYMQKILEESETSLESMRQADKSRQSIDIHQWKRFHLYDNNLFDIDMGTKLDRVKMSQAKPEVNFVGRANTNNGITGRVDKIVGIEPYASGNLSLSLGGEYLGSCFIQPDSFYTSQNVVVLIPKWDMPFSVKQFIATMIFRESRLYYKAFIDELNRHIKTDFSFYLPVIEDGTPDFAYMNEYMQKIMKEFNTSLDMLTQIIR